jgi:aspartate/methionine/tyrosine aminotransferase
VARILQCQGQLVELHAGVCVVPGMDFGVHERDRWVRFTYATSMERLQEAVARIGAFLAALPRQG